MGMKRFPVLGTSEHCIIWRHHTWWWLSPCSNVTKFVSITRTSTWSQTMPTTSWGRRPWRAFSTSTTSPATRPTKTGVGKYSRSLKKNCLGLDDDNIDYCDVGNGRMSQEKNWLDLICRGSRPTPRCQEATLPSATWGTRWTPGRGTWWSPSSWGRPSSTSTCFLRTGMRWVVSCGKECSIEIIID